MRKNSKNQSSTTAQPHVPQRAVPVDPRQVVSPSFVRLGDFPPNTVVNFSILEHAPQATTSATPQNEELAISPEVRAICGLGSDTIKFPSHFYSS